MDLIAIFCKARKEVCDYPGCRGALKSWRFVSLYPCLDVDRVSEPKLCWWAEGVQNAEQNRNDSKVEQWAEIGTRKNVQAFIRPKAKRMPNLEVILFEDFNESKIWIAYRGWFIPRPPGKTSDINSRERIGCCQHLFILGASWASLACSSAQAWRDSREIVGNLRWSHWVQYHHDIQYYYHHDGHGIPSQYYHRDDIQWRAD